MLSKQRGFGLVELLLGLFLGSLLLTLLVQQYLLVKQQSEKTFTAAEEAYDQQIISDLLRLSIRQAGFTPCGSIEQLVVHDHSPLHAQFRDQQHAANRPMKAIVLNAGDNNALQIARMSSDFSVVTQVLSPHNVLIDVAASVPVTFKLQERVLLADCFRAQLTRITAIEQQGSSWRVGLEAAVLDAFVPPIYVGAWLEEQFFVATNAQDKKRLYYQLNHLEELSTHIQSMTAHWLGSAVKPVVGIDFLLSGDVVWHVETALRESVVRGMAVR